MTLARYLVDTSALARSKDDPVAEALRPLIQRGLTGLCGTVALEIFFSSRNVDERETTAVTLDTWEWLPTDDQDFQRAVEVQAELMKSGRHRAAPPADLIIAAVAERYGVTVVHYDSDFDLIAEVTGQPTEWVVARGSVN